MAFASVTTKVTQPWNAIEIQQVLSGGAGTGDLIFTGDMGLGSAHIVLTTAPAITSIQLTVANDGLVGAQTPPILVNPVPLGAALTALPNMIDLMTGTIAAAGPGGAGLVNVSQTPYKYLQFTIVGGGGATVVTISIILVGQRQ